MKRLQAKGREKKARPCGHGACICCESGPQAARQIINDQIQKNGFAFNYIGDAMPQFAYSTGLKETYGLPEIVVIGNFGPDVYNVLADGIDRLARASPETFRASSEIVGIAQLCDKNGAVQNAAVGYVPLAPKYLAADSEWPLTRTIERYGAGHFEAYQLLMFDPSGRLPWHPQYSHEWECHVQQRLLYATATPHDNKPAPTPTQSQN